MGALRERFDAFKERHGRLWVVVLVILCGSFALDRWQDIDFAVNHRTALANLPGRIGNFLFSDVFLVPAFVLVTLLVVWLYSRPLPPPEVRLAGEDTPPPERPSGSETKYPSGRQDADVRPATVGIGGDVPPPGGSSSQPGLSGWTAGHMWQSGAPVLVWVRAPGGGEAPGGVSVKIEGPTGTHEKPPWDPIRLYGVLPPGVAGHEGVFNDYYYVTFPGSFPEIKDKPLPDGDYEIEWRMEQGLGTVLVKTHTLRIKDGVVIEPEEERP